MGTVRTITLRKQVTHTLSIGFKEGAENKLQEMDLKANVCFCCCSVYTKTSLTSIPMDQDRFLNTLLGDYWVSNVRICRSCQGRVELFKQFCEQLIHNFRMFRMITEEQTDTDA